MQSINDQQDNIRRWLRKQAEEACGHWFNEQLKNLEARYYLYYKKGEIKVAEESPGPEWQLASKKYISPAWPRSQAQQFIFNSLQGVEVLPDELIKGSC